MTRQSEILIQVSSLVYHLKRYPTTGFAPNAVLRKPILSLMVRKHQEWLFL
jgi:hypothetical protein